MFSPEQKKFIYENSVKVNDQSKYLQIMGYFDNYFLSFIQIFFYIKSGKDAHFLHPFRQNKPIPDQPLMYFSMNLPPVPYFSYTKSISLSPLPERQARMEPLLCSLA